MEKNENEELLEQSPADIQQEDTQEIAKSGEEEPDTEEQKRTKNRTNVLPTIDKNKCSC